jgi:hypothetical protein
VAGDEMTKLMLWCLFWFAWGGLGTIVFLLVVL